MTRVLLVCPEPLGHGHPAGIGIRFLEMARVLREDGHEVTLLSAPVTPQQIHEASTTNEVAVAQGHIANDVIAHARPIPLVIDLYDPFIVENLHYDDDQIFGHDHATILRSLLHGDFFLCASEPQRQFYLGALLAAGRVNPGAFHEDPTLRSRVAVAPFGVPPPRPLPRSRPHAVLFGGVYDWYDAVLAIETVRIARNTVPDLTLTFTRHPNPAITPQGELARAMEFAARNSLSFVHFTPWVAYDGRADFYDQFAAALMTFPQSLETDLSMRTRVYDFLWSGLPVVSSSAPGTDEILERYGAGVVVRSASAADYAHALLSLLDRRIDTAAFVDAHQWPITLAPLIGFCRHPRIDSSKERFGVRLAAQEREPSMLDRVRRRITRMSSRA